jgi:hypothetical protein
VRAIQRTQFCARNEKNDLNSTYLVKCNFCFETEGVHVKLTIMCWCSCRFHAGGDICTWPVKYFACLQMALRLERQSQKGSTTTTTSLPIDLCHRPNSVQLPSRSHSLSSPQLKGCPGVSHTGVKNLLRLTINLFITSRASENGE